jgi:hypothetical protein
VEGTSPGRAVINAVVCSRVHEPQEALSTGSIASRSTFRSITKGNNVFTPLDAAQ